MVPTCCRNMSGSRGIMSELPLRHIRNLLNSSSATLRSPAGISSTLGGGQRTGVRRGRCWSGFAAGRCWSGFAADSQARSFSVNSPVAKPGTPSRVSRSSSPSKPLWIKAGLPFVLFSVLASWVVSNALEGKIRESEASQGKASKSIRQHQMEQEQNEIMERIGFITKQDFDNTKRIQRPHEVLEERRKERERRNVWYRRAWRWVTGEGV
jgi:hypothetical protein